MNASKAPAGRAAQTTQAPQGANEVSDRGAQRATRALAAGALELFAVDRLAAIYKSAAGDVAALTTDPQSAIYK
ncbi:hypothetical protein DJ68_03335 [Halorubrum sp. C3]|nr:hypothetical protein DJ68_03335 [Halorubrum sp. C3]